VQHFDQFGDDYVSHFLAAAPEPAAMTLGGMALMLVPRRWRRK
jgi:hypothetical protein